MFSEQSGMLEDVSALLQLASLLSDTSMAEGCSFELCENIK